MQSCIVNTNYQRKSRETGRGKGKINHENKNSERRKAISTKKLIRNQNYLKDSIIVMAHVDNATNIGLQNLLNTYLTRGEDILLTMLTFNTENPQECGIVIVDDKGKVINYKEKSEESEGNIANGAVFVFGSELIEWVANNAPNAKDFCADIVPKLIGRINTWHTNDVYIDIGTSKSLDRANKVLGGC